MYVKLPLSAGFVAKDSAKKAMKTL